MKRRTKLAVSLTTFLSVTGASFCGHALQLKGEVGYDSNPFEQASPIDGDSYSAWQLCHRGEHYFSKSQRLQYSASLEGREYDSLEDADQYRMDARVRWVNRFRIGDKSANLMVTGDLRSERQTYFSVSQNQVAETSNGDSLAERFDYDSAKLSMEMVYRFTRRASVSLYSYAAHRNYLEDYQSLGLESLDYNEYNLQPTFRYKSERGVYVRLFVYHKQRHYDELMNDAMNGRNMDSVLQYNFNGVGALLNYPIDRRWNLNIYLHGYNARDNGEGYRDLDYRKGQVKLSYTTAQSSHWALESECYSRDYLEESYRPPESQTGDTGRLRQGCAYSIEFEQPLWLFDGTTWSAKATHHRERNSDDAFDFERETISLGATYVF
ncbi:MAG: hypothetical protein ACRBBW_18575 [Cellvibrionaceae bacterium]